MAMSAAPGRFDALLTQLAQQHGGVESLLDSFFDFLHRKTDFYVVSADPARHKMGFLPGQAEEKVLEAFHKYPIKSLDGHGAATIAKTVTPRSAAKSKVSGANTAKKAVKPKLTEDGKQVPVGNGGVAENYSWTQTLEDVSIQMDVAEGTRAKDLDCRIEASKLRVALKSDPESNHTLNISLEKVKPTWWASALKGGPEIDTTKVDSRRNIQEYDAATQGAIRKAVHDQRQQQLHGTVPLTPEEQMLQEAKDLPGSPFLSSTK